MARVVFIDLWPTASRPGVWKRRFAAVPVAIRAAGYEPEVVHYRRIVPGMIRAEPPAAVILSGSSSNLVADPASDPDGIALDAFAALTGLLADLPRIPVLGICFGFQYLTAAGGGILRRMPVYRRDPAWPISHSRRDPLFVGVRAARCVESHQWQVAQVAPGYRVIARSADGIEAARHRRLPRVGVQFHPEYHRRRGATRDGQDILMNWLRSLARGRTAVVAEDADRPVRRRLAGLRLRLVAQR